MVDKEKKAREGLKKLEVSAFTCQGLSLLWQLCNLSHVRCLYITIKPPSGVMIHSGHGTPTCHVSTLRLAGLSSGLACFEIGMQLYSYLLFHVLSVMFDGLVSAMQSDPELLSRTEAALQQLDEEMEKLRLATQSQ